MGLIGVMGVMRLMGGKPEMQNTPAQRDSIMSILGVLRILGILGILGRENVRQEVRMKTKKRKTKMRPVQRDSKISILKTGPFRPLDFKTTPAQRHSKMSNGRMSGVSCWPHGGRLSEALCWPHGQNSPAQRGSKNSKLGAKNIITAEGAENTEDVIFTMRIKNITDCFMGRRVNESMSKMQNSPAQRDSIMSILKIETENSLPQRHSKMSNGRLSGLLCWPHGQRAMSTALIKNIVNAIGVMGVMGQRHKIENTPAQHGSQNSKLDFPLCLCDSVFKAVQQDSGIYNFSLFCGAAILKTEPG